MVATAQVVEQDRTFAGAIDLSPMPAPLQQLFEEYEEIVHTHMFSLLDEIEEKIEVLHLKVVFEDDHEAALADVQIYPSTKKVAFQVVKGDETIAPLRRGSIVGTYFAQLNKALESDTDAKQTALLFAHRLGSEYFLAILRTMSEIDRLCREMESVLNEFTGRDLHGTLFTGKLLTIEHLAIAMKLYVISWSTLRDMLASLVNAVFNLAIADRDVKEYLILHNSHVKSSRIPRILQAYDNTLLIKGLKKKRNDVVHRGRIPDDDIEQILTERNRIDSRHYSLLEQNPISEEEHKRQISLLQQKLRALAKEKQALWRKRHQQTIAMISEIAGALVLTLCGRGEPCDLPFCRGGALRVIAAITDESVMARILCHLKRCVPQGPAEPKDLPSCSGCRAVISSLRSATNPRLVFLFQAVPGAACIA